MKAIPNSVKNKRVSNARQRKQQHLLDVKIRESKERSRRFRAVSGWISKVVLFGGLGAGAWFGGKEGLRHFVWENPDYFLREINVMTDGALTREQVLIAAGLAEGRNIFTVELAKARSGVEALPQVESAVVQRLLPNRMTVTVSERRPIAWIAAKGDEDPSTSERSFLVDGRGIVLRSRVVLPEYHHLPIISGFETENLVLGKRVPALELQSVLELVRLNADNTRCQLRHIDLAKGYCLVALDQKRREITFGLDEIDAQLARLNLCLDQSAREGREIQTINVIPRINIPVTFVPAQNELTPVVNAAEPPPRKPEPVKEKPVEIIRKAEAVVIKPAATPANSARPSRTGSPVKKPFFSNP